jgi:hypothetical protein
MLPRVKTLVINEGNDPECIHREEIVGNIGTCVVCGRQKDYGRFIQLSETEGVGVAVGSSPARVATIRESTQQQRSLGGQNGEPARRGRKKKYHGIQD